jgi:hypothetical protein
MMLVSDQERTITCLFTIFERDFPAFICQGGVASTTLLLPMTMLGRPVKDVLIIV